MKQLLVLFVLLTLVSIGDSAAQGFVEAPKASTSVTLSDITIDGLTVKGGVTKSGNTFVLRTSAKSGKEYRQYLGKATGKTFTIEGRQVPVFVKSHKDGTVSYYAVFNKSGKLSTKKVVKE